MGCFLFSIYISINLETTPLFKYGEALSWIEAMGLYEIVFVFSHFN